MTGAARRFSIEDAFKQLAGSETAVLPVRPEFRDPLLVSFQDVQLSRVIDAELDRFYNPSGPVELISRVFRRLRRPAS